MVSRLTIGQVFVNGGYVPSQTLYDHPQIVGQPLFVQVDHNKDFDVALTPAGAGFAPRRRAPQVNGITDVLYKVEMKNDGKLSDRLYVQTKEEKADEYIIGEDVAKMGVSKSVAQMWIDRYDVKLSISAPNNGEQVLSAVPVKGEATLYLTQNGKVIWNLSSGEYMLNLSAGTTTEYGLRISAKSPQTATGIDEAVVDAQDDIRKVLIGSQVFIIRGNKVYTIDGQMVK